jgi:ribonuclease-3
VLSDSEESSGGRDKTTILADACEALLGAIFLEAGYTTARDVVRAHWGTTLEGGTEAGADAKSALQEWAQGQGLELPQYDEVARSGPDHAPCFTAEVRIKGKKPARGDGASKRAAEQAAATALLVREGVWPDA